MTTDKWTYHYGSEDYWDTTIDDFDTKEEAIQVGLEAAEEYDNYDHFFVGQIEEYTPHIDATDVIDWAVEDACDTIGSEFADSWIDHTTKEDRNNLSDKLTEVFQSWLKETKNWPNFFKVRCIETIQIPERQ